MRKIFILLIIIYAQPAFAQTISMEDEDYYRRNELPYPKGTTYVKDVNHRLDSFVGIWKGNNNGWLYEVRFSKKENWNFGICTPGVNWDVLIGRILVRDSISGNIIYNTLNTSDNLTYFSGHNAGSRAVSMSFYGPENGCYDEGDVIIALKIGDVTAMSLWFYRGGHFIDPRTCPGGYDNYRTVLPAKLLLQKQ